MGMKKGIGFLLVLVLLLSVVPRQVFAQNTGAGYVEESITELTQASVAQQLATATADEGPQLAEGNHEKWIDRIKNLPDYALEFYQWLESNATAEGVLSDPTLATANGGNYLHTVGSVQNTVTYTFTPGASDAAIKEAAGNAVVTAMGDTPSIMIDYAKTVFGAFDRDHPEVFWLEGQTLYSSSYGYNYTYNRWKGTGSVTYTLYIYFYLQYAELDFDIRAKDYRDTARIAQDIALREEAVESILADCPDTTVHEQLYYLNRYLTQTNAYNSQVAVGIYDTAAATAWECISALQGTAGVQGPVCEGYSRAFKVLCDRLGIPCVLVEGNAKFTADGTYGGHMWNYVQLEDNWYAVDVTWNDPYVSSNMEAKISGYENEYWMLLGGQTVVGEDLTFLQSHVVTNTTSTNSLQYVNGPVLSDTDYVPTEPALTIPSISLRYPALSFEDVIVMNVFFAAENLDDVVEMGLVTYGEAIAEASVDTAEYVIPGYTWSDSDGFYYANTQGIAPHYLANTYYFAVYTKLTDGTYTYTKVVSYSPLTYANSILNGTGFSADMKTLAAAMLNYGAAAQVYFGVEGELMNAGLTTEVAPYSDSMIQDPGTADPGKIGVFANNQGFSRRYPNITLEGAFSINYFFTPAYTPAGDVTLYYWNEADYAAADLLTPANASGSLVMTGEAQLTAAVTGIAAKDLDSTIYVAALYSDTSGNTWASGVLPYSIGAYCKSQANTEGSMQALAQATAVYAYYAKQLFS